MEALRKLGCLIFILALTVPCFAKKEVHLKGQWRKKIKSIIPALPIHAWVEDNNKDLLLEFSANLGTVEVTITNSVGEVVYKQSVEAQPSVVISLEEEMRDGDVVLVTDGENVIYGSL
ncbi:DUF3244 domain-containing protein [uncultured Parabacteroides sp.]|uniref:DUF3244 domain-containing protein n=1 Tax=uncultured Parabacteroides sp. TaxID=512312 RepID=UPI0026080CD9|nr:DUF3244 domain-containing protein [uncultured Parabacteroides sp.]